MARTLEQVDNALDIVELFLGPSAIYTSYGNTIGQALDQYARPLYNELLTANGVKEFNAGDRWFDETDDLLWTYVDITAGAPDFAAEWQSQAVPTTQPGSPVFGDMWFDESINTLYEYTTVWDAGTVLEVTQAALAVAIVDTPGIITFQFKGPEMTNIDPLHNLQFTILAKQLHGADATLRLVRLNASNEITNEAVYTIGIFTNALTIRATAAGDFVIGQLYTFFWSGTSFLMSGFDYASITSRLNALENHYNSVTNEIDILNGNLHSALDIQTDLTFIGAGMTLTNAGGKLFRFDVDGGYATGAYNFTGADLKVKTFIPDETDVYDSYPIPYLLFKNEVANVVDSAVATKFIIDTRSPSAYEAEEGVSLPNGTIYMQKGSVVE